MLKMIEILSPKEFAEKMNEAAKQEDIEYAHIEMDNLMAELLRSIGYQDGIDIFEDAEKWYA